MKSQNRTAILLAAYNGKQWLDEQVESIFQQIDIDIHIFISVDLSSDGTYEWCKDCEKNHSNVTVLSYGESFGGAGKNFYRLIRDVDLSEFDYVAFADQDDIWLENKLSRAIEIIKGNDLDGFSSDVIAFWPDGREALVKKSYPQKEFDFYFEAAGPGCTYVLTQNLFKQFKYFLNQNLNAVNEVASHDWVIYSLCRALGLKWHIDNIPLMKYRQHDSNQVGFNSGVSAYLKRISMVKDKWYRNEIEKTVQLLAAYSTTSFSMSRWFLVKHFWQLRRRPRDAYALLAMLIWGLF